MKRDMDSFAFRFGLTLNRITPNEIVYIFCNNIKDESSFKNLCEIVKRSKIKKYNLVNLLYLSLFLKIGKDETLLTLLMNNEDYDLEFVINELYSGNIDLKEVLYKLGYNSSYSTISYERFVERIMFMLSNDKDLFIRIVKIVKENNYYNGILDLAKVAFSSEFILEENNNENNLNKAFDYDLIIRVDDEKILERILRYYIDSLSTNINVLNDEQIKYVIKKLLRGSNYYFIEELYKLIRGHVPQEYKNRVLNIITDEINNKNNQRLTETYRKELYSYGNKELIKRLK